MLLKIFYYDIFLGHPGQAPTAFTRIPIRMAALSYEDALKRAVELGFNEAEIMHMERFVVKAKNGNTVVQYLCDDCKTMDAYIFATKRAKAIVSARTKLRGRKYGQGVVDRMPDAID